MKKFRKVIVLLLVLFAGLFVTSCDNKNDDSQQEVDVGEWFE